MEIEEKNVQENFLLCNQSIQMLSRGALGSMTHIRHGLCVLHDIFSTARSTRKYARNSVRLISLVAEKVNYLINYLFISSYSFLNSRQSESQRLNLHLLSPMVLVSVLMPLSVM